MALIVKQTRWEAWVNWSHFLILKPFKTQLRHHPIIDPRTLRFPASFRPWCHPIPSAPISLHNATRTSGIVRSFVLRFFSPLSKLCFITDTNPPCRPLFWWVPFNARGSVGAREAYVRKCSHHCPLLHIIYGVASCGTGARRVRRVWVNNPVVIELPTTVLCGIYRFWIGIMHALEPQTHRRVYTVTSSIRVYAMKTPCSGGVNWYDTVHGGGVEWPAFLRNSVVRSASMELRQRYSHAIQSFRFSN